MTEIKEMLLGIVCYVVLPVAVYLFITFALKLVS